MSTLLVENIKHEDATSPAIVLKADGGLTVNSSIDELSIGTSTPDLYSFGGKLLTVSGGATHTNIILASDTNSGIAFGTTSGRLGQITVDSTNGMRFFSEGTGNGLTLTFDRSKNIFTGTTSTPHNLSTGGGFSIRTPINLVSVARQDNEVMILNRTGTDGDILTFRKNGNNFGFIGTDNAQHLYVESNVGTGLDFRGDILPRYNSALDSGSNVDIGATSYPFRDIVLSGTTNTGYLTLASKTVATLDSNAGVGSVAYSSDDGGNLFFKNSTGWKSITAPLGSEANPAQSAQQIIEAGDSVGDGVYWFQPSGYNGSAFQVYCDMTNFGGGWMLISKWYQDSPYTLDELFNANARNANTTYLLNNNQLTAKSTHSRLSRDQTNALWNQSSYIARIVTVGSSYSSAVNGNYFQKKITNTNNFDFWNAHYNARAWSDDTTSGNATAGLGSLYKVMRYESHGEIFTDNTYTDFSQPSGLSGIGWWDHVQVAAPNYGNMYISRHMGFYGDINSGNQWLLTCNPSDTRYTSADSDEGKASIVYLK